MTKPPLVTIAMASHNAAGFIEAALDSVLGQSLEALEVIVVDDASSDDSRERAAAVAARDPRVRLEVLARNMGPAAARNRALELARGQWLAVVDSDDLIHPGRLERLIAAAEAHGADMIADDLMVFDAADPGGAERFLRGARRRRADWVSLEDYLAETVLFSGAPNLGYLKPVVRLDRWRAAGVRYDETLRIAEDDDLIVRLLAAGLRYRLEPYPSYLYRKHSSSISHRLSPETVGRMVAAQERLAPVVASCGRGAVAALERRRRATLDAGAFVAMVEALKARKLGAALAEALRRPSGLRLFGLVIEGRLARLTQPRPATSASPAPRRLCVISRQRLVGATNGSSAYLLDLVGAARAAGFEPHLVQPAPSLLGRWPILRLKPEMAVFASIAIRGIWKIGPLVIARDPGIYLAAARGVLAEALGRLKLPSAWLGAKPAPYAISEPWSAEDLRFTARHAPRSADAIIADYMFQGEAIAYALRPDSPSAIVMHDLFHARSSGFAAQAATDSTAQVDEATETRLLSQSDAVIAIQKAEAEWVRDHLPASRVILAPMAAKPAAQIAPGADDALLFVGSNTAPNVVALQWLFAEVWPLARARRPGMTLKVAGNVSRAFSTAPEGVHFLGPVGDLGPLYAEAGVVISPLHTGSGLKVKLIEAVAQGKAVAATTVTLQGVETELGDCVRVADAAPDFAAAMVELAGDGAARAELAQRALDAARTRFSAQVCYRDFVGWLNSR